MQNHLYFHNGSPRTLQLHFSHSRQKSGVANLGDPRPNPSAFSAGATFESCALL
jgi:hypothetical protein